ncbi:MAG: glutamine--tRNA ligase/YqeY domain fusion protein, partial [Planctomycetes bacterium]|nr:glutamine--tRNA ligase/YqeY domain fusion protein [Planctomycetota bacterium]
MSDTKKSLNFIEEIIEEDNRTGKWDGRVHTRFPPEPNGYLHIGHAKSICLNFGLAEKYGGRCNLRFDDTNPTKEEQEYIDSIIEDVRWLGFDYGDEPLFASNYFQQMYNWAVQLIKDGKAYVDDLSADAIREYRGTLTTPGRDSPFRERSVEENIDLFERMRKGEFADGEKVLRAKIDMASPNINLRDPVMYRILHAAHPRTGNDWCIYPMYDWAHGLEDSIEGITHSICTLEFEIHRPLYDWFLDALDLHHPQQIEFARLNLNYTIMSKRKLLQLVSESHVSGWDDPRMPTLSGLRRRGYTPESIREFCRRVGVAKVKGVSEMALLEHCLREHLNKVAPRVMGVLRPLKVVIENYPDGQVEELDAINNPEDESAGTRKVPFSKTIYIEQADFMEDAPRKFFRLAPGREVRLRYAYWIKCTDVSKNDAGEVIELRCTYDPQTRGGNNPPDG